MITVEHTIRSYAGKPGCMCGCLGKYNTTPRARKLAITQLLKDPDVTLHAWSDGGCVFVRTATRYRVLYLTEQGVAAARAVGVTEE